MSSGSEVAADTGEAIVETTIVSETQAQRIVRGTIVLLVRGTPAGSEQIYSGMTRRRLSLFRPGHPVRRSSLEDSCPEPCPQVSAKMTEVRADGRRDMSKPQRVYMRPHEGEDWGSESFLQRFVDALEAAAAAQDEPTDDERRLAMCVDIATKAHEGQLDKAGSSPAIRSHCRSSMRISPTTPTRIVSPSCRKTREPG